ncbi:MAG: hypothetical protein C0483_11290 [Pirellula sp.]|nr:hypothetical protein [Pirellula sp.]
MLWKVLLTSVVAVVSVAGNAHAARVTKFVVTCVDRTDSTDDDVYLAGVRDGKPVSWGEGHQHGTSAGNSANLSEKDADHKTLALDAKSLAELDFTTSLEISVKEKDVTVEQLIGTVKIAANDGSKTVVLKGGDGDDAFEYHVEYSVAP